MTKPLSGFDPQALLRDEIVVDKLDAACRQLDTAITMFFEGWDVVSQHTLISAAYGILYDLSKHRSIRGSVKDSLLCAQRIEWPSLRQSTCPRTSSSMRAKTAAGSSRSDTRSATSSYSMRFASSYFFAGLRLRG